MFFPFTFKLDSVMDTKGVRGNCKLFKKELFSFSKSFNGNSEEEDLPVEESPETSKTADEEKTFTARDSKAKPSSTSDLEESEKPSLTSTQFWSILLTPEFDVQAWWATKKLLYHICRLLHLKFNNCFVEGIRTDYYRMGQLAALNGFLQGFPYIGAWDFRMDWTHSKELRGECHIRATTNLTRFTGLCIAILFYGGITAFRFWRRRAHVLKTNELPELDWVRKKIVKFMAED